MEHIGPVNSIALNNSTKPALLKIKIVGAKVRRDWGVVAGFELAIVLPQEIEDRCTF